MIKREELTNPKSCMSRADDDEMTFVLLARDEAAPYAIKMWAAERVRLGKNQIDDPQIVEAYTCAYRMGEQRKAKPDQAAPKETPTCAMEGCKNKATRGTPPTWCAPCAESIMFDVERPDLNCAIPAADGRDEG